MEVSNFSFCLGNVNNLVIDLKLGESYILGKGKNQVTLKFIISKH